MLPPYQAPPSAIDDKRRLHAKWRVLPDAVVDDGNLAVLVKRLSGRNLNCQQVISFFSSMGSIRRYLSDRALPRILRWLAANSSSSAGMGHRDASG